MPINKFTEITVKLDVKLDLEHPLSQQLKILREEDLEAFTKMIVSVVDNVLEVENKKARWATINVSY
jgi:hypothetical protein